MKITKTQRPRNARLPVTKSYQSHSRLYEQDIDVLDTDEDVVLQQIDLQDTDEGILLHYYNNTISQDKISLFAQSRRKAEAKNRRA